MPVAIAAAATLVHLVLLVSIWVTVVPGATLLGLATVAAMAVAAFLLRDQDRLFTVAAVAFVVELCLALLVLTVRPELVPIGGLGAGVGVLLALAGVVATVTFLVGLARVVAAERLLRVGYLGVAVVSGVLGTGQVLLHVALAVGPDAVQLIDLALVVYGTSWFWAPVLLDAVTLLLLAATWVRYSSTTPLRRHAVL